MRECLRVLVVDDNRDTCKSLCALVSAWGHDCKAAADGAEALATASAFAPEVLLLDLGMPGMDGYEVVRRARELPGLAGAYFVACSGLGDVDHVRRAMDAGFDGHLLKPVDPVTIRDLLKRRAVALRGKDE